MMLLWFLLGLILLAGGAELLVRGAAALARAAGISSLVVGLTVVACGTSSPEMAVSIGAGLTGAGEIAVGNVVGSNIFNVLFILGGSALVAPLVVSRQLLRQDIPIMITLSLVPVVLGWDGAISRMDGILAVALLAGYSFWLIRQSRRMEPDRGEANAALDEPDNRAPEGRRALVVNLVMAIVGLGLLLLGARWLVHAAVAFAETLGVDKLIVGLRSSPPARACRRWPPPSSPRYAASATSRSATSSAATSSTCWAYSA